MVLPLNDKVIYTILKTIVSYTFCYSHLYTKVHMMCLYSSKEFCILSCAIKGIFRKKKKHRAVSYS